MLEKETSTETQNESNKKTDALTDSLAKESSPEEKFAQGMKLFDQADFRGHNDQALLLLDELEKIAVTEDKKTSVLIKRGAHFLRQSRFEEAAVYLEQAIIKLSSQPDSLDLFHAYRNLAWIYFRQGYIERARSFSDGAQMVLEMRAGQDTPELQSARASLYHILGLIESSSGEHNTAIKYYDQEIEILEQLGEEERLSPVYNNLSGIYKTKGMFAKALEYQIKSFKLAEQSGEMLSMAISCNNLGEIYYALGKYEQSAQYYQWYLEINNKIKNRVGDAFGYAGLGRIHQSNDNFKKAKEQFEKALAAAREVKSKGKEASILSEKAELYCRWNKLDKATECLDRAIKISIEIERFNTQRHQVLNAKITMIRGFTEGKKDLLEKARDTLLDVISHPIIIEDEEAISEIEVEIETHFYLAKIYHALNEKGSALEHISKATELVEIIAEQLKVELKNSFLQKREVGETYSWQDKIKEMQP